MTKKNILITAASSDIGISFTKYLIHQSKDSNIFCVSRSENEELTNLKEHGKIQYLSNVDLLNFKQEIMDHVNNYFQDSFDLVHCAGDYWYHNSFFEITTDEAVRMMNSHYGTLYNTLQHFLPLMLSRGGGNILTFSCNSTRYNFPNMVPFTAAKAAVDAVVKCIANEFSKDGIIINSLALATLRTEKNTTSKPYGDHQNYISLQQINQVILHTLTNPNTLINGNVINCFQYSPDYYNKGYFERIKK